MNKEYCPSCDNEMTYLTNQTKTIKFKTPNGVQDIQLKELSFYKCTNCEEIIYTPQDLEIYDTKLNQYHDEKRKEKNLLTASEIKQIRESTGLNQQELETLLDVGAKSFTRWESNKVEQSRAIDWLLRLIRKNGINCLKELENSSATSSSYTECASKKTATRSTKNVKKVKTC